MNMKIKTGDKVRVIAGKDKGKEGKVTQVFPKLNRVIVEGVNKSVKHLRARASQKGQRVEYNGPIHASNVQVIGKMGIGRVGYKFLQNDGHKTKIRVLKKTGKQEDID